MKPVMTARIDGHEAASAAVCERSTQHALNNPDIARYVRRLQRIPMAYKRILEQFEKHK